MGFSSKLHYAEVVVQNLVTKVAETLLVYLLFTLYLKGHFHENHFKNSRVQKHIYSNGNLGEVVYFHQNNSVSVMKLKKELISLC